jgi:hypothetical protein
MKFSATHDLVPQLYQLEDQHQVLLQAGGVDHGYDAVGPLLEQKVRGDLLVLGGARERVRPGEIEHGDALSLIRHYALLEGHRRSRIVRRYDAYAGDTIEQY